LDDSLDEKLNDMEDMHEPDLQADDGREGASGYLDELPDGAVESATDEAGDDRDGPPVNLGFLKQATA